MESINFQYSTTIRFALLTLPLTIRTESYPNEKPAAVDKDSFRVNGPYQNWQKSVVTMLRKIRRLSGMTIYCGISIPFGDND